MSHSKSHSEDVGRDGFEHHYVGDMSYEEIQLRMEQLLSSEPSKWSKSEQIEWEQLSTEICRQKNSSRVFSIGDKAILVGYTMTETSGAVSYMDEYNKNELEVVVTGYAQDSDTWEVMITEDTLEDIVSESKLNEERWREMYLTERPANGRVTGYVMTCTYQGRIGESGLKRKGLYSE